MQSLGMKKGFWDCTKAVISKVQLLQILKVSATSQAPKGIMLQFQLFERGHRSHSIRKLSAAESSMT